MPANKTKTAAKVKKPAKKRVRKKPVVISMADDPFRARDWRWKRVMYLMSTVPGGDKTRPCTACDDVHVRRAKAYLVQRDKLMASVIGTKPGSTDLDFVLMPLRVTWPDIVQAQAIWEEAQFRRWVIEALIIADVSADDVAAEFGCDKAIIAAYELFFYDIRSRLSNELYIAGELLSPALVDDSATASRDSDFFWKAIAYRGGDTLVRTFFSYKAIPENLRAEIMAFIGDMEYRNVAKASTTRQINQYNAHELMDEHLQRRQMEENNQNLSDTAEQMVAGAQAMLGAVGFAVASIGNVGDSPVEERVSKTIKVLADEDNSGNNGDGKSDTSALPPCDIMAKRIQGNEAEAEAVDKKKERVPKSAARKKPAGAHDVTVEPLSSAEEEAAEAARSAKDASANKKQDALNRIKRKKGKK